jgi:polysaccharide biosynthesis/export protein
MPTHRDGGLRLGLQLAVTGFLFVSQVACFGQTTAQEQSRPSTSVTTPASSAGETNSNPLPAPVPAMNQSQYVISPGDVLEVSVFGAPDLSQKTAVNSSGNIYMPLISYVHVAGMHVDDAQGVVEQAYFKSGVLKNPHVSVAVTSYSSGVVLIGEVSRPGIYPIVGSGKLFDILAEAGGPTANAGQLVAINHKGNTEPTTVFLTNDPAKSMEANVPVQQGDTIIVSRAGVIYVVGEVLSPNSFLMDEKGQYTVMKAVAMARGLTKFAKPSKARIVRREAGGEQEIPIPLDKILVSQAQDVPMQSNDILFVPSSKGKIAAAKTVDVAIALASGLAFYGAYH